MPLIFKDFCNLYGNFSKIYITKKTKKKNWFEIWNFCSSLVVLAIIKTKPSKTQKQI